MAIATLTDENLLNRPKKLGIMGESGSGKTHKLLEAMTWARSQVDTPEELLFGFIDCDDGVRPLIQRGLLPTDIRPRIQYGLYYQDWNNIKKDSLELIPQLKDHARDHGPNSTWLMVDNLSKVWEWLQEDFTLDVFGFSRKDMMRQARKEAHADGGKKMKPIMSRMHDYAVLNAEFYGWWDPIQFSDINFLVTAPAWLNRSPEDRTVITDVNIKGVQPDLVHRIDELFWVHNPDNAGTVENHYSSLVKRRNVAKKFSNVKDLSFANWMKWCEKYALDEPLSIPE